MALSGPRKVIKLYFVDQIPILTVRSCSVTLKTLFFKNIQLELLYSFRAKFLTPANTMINSSMFSTLIFIHWVNRSPIVWRWKRYGTHSNMWAQNLSHVRYRADALCQQGDLSSKIKSDHLAGNRERNEIQKNMILSISFPAAVRGPSNSSRYTYRHWHSHRKSL